MIALTIFRFRTVALDGCSTRGEMPPIPAAYGARRRSRVSAAMRRTGMCSSTLMYSPQRKAKIGCGGAAIRCRRPMTAPSCICRAEAQTRSCCANSIYRHGILCLMGSACLSPRAVLSGSTVIRCFYRPHSGPAWQPEAAMRAPFDYGGVEAIRCRPPSSSRPTKNPWACGPCSTGRFRRSASGS